MSALEPDDTLAVLVLGEPYPTLACRLWARSNFDAVLELAPIDPEAGWSVSQWIAATLTANAGTLVVPLPESQDPDHAAVMRTAVEQLFAKLCDRPTERPVAVVTPLVGCEGGAAGLIERAQAELARQGSATQGVPGATQG